MRRPVTNVDRVTALLLFLAAFIALGTAQRSQGVMRDEAYYFKAAEEQWSWFEQLGDDKLRGDMANRYNIARYWSYNNEHPPLFKTLSGLSWRIFHGYQPVGPGKDAVYHAQWKHPHEALNIMSEISAFRLPAWFLTALCVAFIYLFGARLEGRLCGFSAALIYLTIPRVFFHGQIAGFDSAVTSERKLTGTHAGSVRPDNAVSMGPRTNRPSKSPMARTAARPDVGALTEQNSAALATKPSQAASAA